MGLVSMDFYKNKKVLITGHTGFKGSWMCETLINAGADVIGYALKPPTTPSLFYICRLDERMKSIEGDIRDLQRLINVFKDETPEIVIHLAAQPLVRESYKNPVHTYEVNVIGTVNICEAIRKTDTVRSFLNITTDKVYLNREWEWGYRENEVLNGFDPYSNSKSCSELITECYKNSFFQRKEKENGFPIPAISTCRAGNVIGGGDFAADRIIPDCIRAASNGEVIVARNPYSTRPYQHVIEPIVAYLRIIEAQYKDRKYAGAYNVGPNDENSFTTGDLVSLFCDKWNNSLNNITRNKAVKATWISKHEEGPHEANYLKLDCSKIKSILNWQPSWNLDIAVEKTVEWTIAYLNNQDVLAVMDSQIDEYLSTLNV